MCNCPSDWKLAQLIDGVLPDAEQKAICRHALECAGCAQVLADAGLLSELEKLQLLEAPAPVRQERALRKLKAVMGEHPVAGFSRFENATADTQKPSLLSRLDEYIFAGALAEGAAALSPFSGAVPALGADSDQDIGLDSAPGVVSTDIKQGYTNSCAIRCQELILRDFDMDVSEHDLCEMAVDEGWYDPEFGSFAADVGMLLEAHHVDVNTYDNATIFNLTHELAQGHRVIVSVDSGELWQKNDIYMGVMEQLQDTFQGDVPDHAVLVSGVEFSDPDHPQVVITDPGTGEVAAAYPLEQFLDSWEDSGFHMVATAEAPPTFALAHVHAIGDVPYEQFAHWYPALADVPPEDAVFEKLCNLFDEMLGAGTTACSELVSAMDAQLAHFMPEQFMDVDLYDNSLIDGDDFGEDADYDEDGDGDWLPG